jgi:hypothetical protein
MAPNIYAAGAGTAADCDHVSGKYYHFCKNLRAVFLKRVLTKNINFAAEMIKRELELHRFNTHSENRV